MDTGEITNCDFTGVFNETLTFHEYFSDTMPIK